ncbi:hypothetical protein SAY86_028448 [Trapa natans]|uniref:SET domain-containing protein n=1 Tax=Trapa natans TaxID=22666 RepID=A0AAN7M171_TRANT|nr:hypothetical protein SAY86_028448 [Trapa natans]
MGDGGVACIPLQHSSIMDMLSVPEKPLCGGNNGSSSNNGFSSQPIDLAEPEVMKKKKKKIKKVVKRVVSIRKVKTLKRVVAAGKNNSNKEIENGQIFTDKSQPNDDVEEGELGTLKSPSRETENGEIRLDNPQTSDTKKEVAIPDKRKEERLKEKEECTSIKSGELEKGEITPEKGQRGEVEKSELRLWEGSDDEIEKGEFIPDGCHQSEFTRDCFSNPKSRSRYDTGKERSRRHDFECTLPLRKYSNDDISRSKELSRRAGSPLDKEFYRWEDGRERSSRLSSKIVNEDGYRVGHSDDMNQDQRREYFLANRLKSQSGHHADSDGSDRDHDYSYKHHGDYSADYMGSKSRRLSDDGARLVYSDHHSRRSLEGAHKISSSSRVSSTDKYTFPHPESSSSSRGSHGRNARSPVYSDRPPRDRPRQSDHRDRSPVGHERSPFVRDRSPYYARRTLYGRERSPCGRERTPHGHGQSPHDRNHHSDRRNKNSIHSQKSPQDGGRYHNRMDQKHSSRERSLQDRGKSHSQDAIPKTAELYTQDQRRHNVRRDQNQASREPPTKSQNNLEAGQKVGTSDKPNSQAEGKGGEEEKQCQIVSKERNAIPSLMESQDRILVKDVKAQPAFEKNDNCKHQNDDPVDTPASCCKESYLVDGGALPEELVSMEEDMDICNTPPHVPIIEDSPAGNWVYLDYCGAECGPSKLCELKTLVEEGVLYSDHFIRHLDSNRWVTIENASSPLVTPSFQSIIPDNITQLVNPPEAPGNSLVDNGDAVQLSDDLLTTTNNDMEFCIDERVAALLEGFNIAPDKELDTIGEALQMTFDHDQWDKWGSVEGFIWHRACIGELHDQNEDDTSSCPAITYSEFRECTFCDQDISSDGGNSSIWLPGQWSCKGGDWKRNEETNQDRPLRRKLVLNDGFPLCQMQKSGFEDPRWLQKDELYYTSHDRRLDLPLWAYSWPEEKSDSDGAGRSQVKPVILRGVRGTLLSVVRINACVVKDRGSFISETRSRSRGKDRYASRSARPQSNSDIRRCSIKGDSQSKAVDDHHLRGSRKNTAGISTPKDRVCTAHELQLHLGDWYYLDGAGRERGPASFSELQSLVGRGTIQNNISVFRKFDKLWVPVTSFNEVDGPKARFHQESASSSICSSRAPAPKLCGSSLEENYSNNSFHRTHPQFIGYMRGKLHELVMRYYKSRAFSAAINEVLDPWINAKQPKKQTEKQIYRKSDAYLHASKRARLLIEESEEETEIDVLQKLPWGEQSFEDLYPDVTFIPEETASCGNSIVSCGPLVGGLLARVFHFLGSDMKSFFIASSTCKHWRAVARIYKNVTRQVDVSSLGPCCTDSVLGNIIDGFDRTKINSMILAGCSNVSSDALEDIIHSCPCLSYIDIRGCSQLAELTLRYTNVHWIKSRWNFGNMMSKIKSLTHLTDKNSSNSVSNSMGSDVDDFGGLRDYFASVDRRDSSGQSFRRGFYKRSKVFGARKALSILPGDARVRRWDAKKSEKGYKIMEEFLISSLKEIMKENTSDFFVQKVADIEYRIKSGYYIRRGISSIKEDISRMCRDAIKAKTRGDIGDMNHIITLFIQLALRLEGGSKSSFQKDDIKSWRDDSSAGSSVSSKHKKINKVESERKSIYRSNASSLNGVFDGDYFSDWEIRRRLLKLNKRATYSESETPDEYDDFSSGTSRCNGETTASETESDLESKAESRPGEPRGDDFLLEDEGLDSLGYDREWGARMTKASLVPPVTRKYEVIDQYLIVTDEENVKEKMQVALPEDYAEKLDVLKNGTEELDMELPEVKDYKPRKELGLEVIEQEVYGIDPYTHNLLLDSMPEELDWTLTDKHWFIEEVLLCTLNKQVRHFTGKGSTPMMYPLQPVIEEVERVADEDHDIRTIRMCQGILRAIDSRPEDKYVAYRKGLGVVCHKEGGFGEDDFIVEFLGEVYPTWRWFEKQDGIRSLQKNNKDPAPEFYNIYLERPKGDADGYDLVVVDAMHKANYASRICHSCKPNCEAKVTAVDGRYQIGIYSVRKIQFGEEITFDYNSVTESKEEYEASVCLCGSQICRGSYLNLTGEGAFQKILEEWHGILDRYQLMVEACEINSVSNEDYYDLGRAGLGSCMLGGLPDWLVAYSARLVRFINFERTKLPQEILKHNLEEKRKYFLDINLENEKSEAEIQAEGVYNQRLQNLAITLDKVRYVMTQVFSDPKKAPPPLERLSPEETVSFLWSGEGSLVKELFDCITPHSDADTLNELMSKINEHDPSGSDDLQMALTRSLLWLRDEMRDLSCTPKCRHDAAADLIHIYAHTKSFFKLREYKTLTSPPVFISPLDLGPKYSDKLGGDGHEYCKTYGENYCIGQLIFWYLQTNSEPDNTLFRMSRGCLSLPDVGSFYAKLQKPPRQRVYGTRTVRFMLARMEKQPQRPWPKDRIWTFKSSPKVFGSPMLDSVLKNTPLDREMVHWLKNRISVFHAMRGPGVFPTRDVLPINLPEYVPDKCTFRTPLVNGGALLRCPRSSRHLQGYAPRCEPPAPTRSTTFPAPPSPVSSDYPSSQLPPQGISDQSPLSYSSFDDFESSSSGVGVPTSSSRRVSLKLIPKQERADLHH